MPGSLFRVQDDYLHLGSQSIHYAWVIVVLATIMWTISSSFRFATAVLLDHLQDPVDGFGWGYAWIAVGYSIQWIISAFASPVMGWLGERYGLRRLLVLGAALFVLGMVLTGYMTEIWQFYLYFGFLLGVAMTVFQVPLVSSVTTWFRTNLGAAVGGMQAIQSLGTILLLPIVALLFSISGLSWTFWLPGIIGGVFLFIMIPFYFDEPSKAGMRPYGADPDEPVAPGQRDAATKIRNQVFFAQARRTGAFWNLIGIHCWACMGHNIFIVFLLPWAIHPGHLPGLGRRHFHRDAGIQHAGPLLRSHHGRPHGSQEHDGPLLLVAGVPLLAAVVVEPGRMVILPVPPPSSG